MSNQYLCARVRMALHCAGSGEVPNMKHLKLHTCRSLSTSPWELLPTLTVTATSTLNNILRPPRAHGRSTLESSWNVMTHGDAQEGKWRGNWRMECVASNLHTSSEHGVSSITTADAHTSGASIRLNWRPSADLNGLVRFAERLNLVSARVPSQFKGSLPHLPFCFVIEINLFNLTEIWLTKLKVLWVFFSNLHTYF